MCKLEVNHLKCKRISTHLTDHILFFNSYVHQKQLRENTADILLVAQTDIFSIDVNVKIGPPSEDRNYTETDVQFNIATATITVFIPENLETYPKINTVIIVTVLKISVDQKQWNHWI